MVNIPVPWILWEIFLASQDGFQVWFQTEISLDLYKFQQGYFRNCSILRLKPGCQVCVCRSAVSWKARCFFKKFLQHNTALVKSEVLLLSILITGTNQWIILLLVIGGRDWVIFYATYRLLQKPKNMLNQCHLPIPIETTSAPASEHRTPGSMKGATHRWWKQGWFVHFRQRNAKTEKNGSKKTAISFYREPLNASSTWGELLVCLGMNWDHSWILNDSLKNTSIYREDS